MDTPCPETGETEPLPLPEVDTGPAVGGIADPAPGSEEAEQSNDSTKPRWTPI